MIRNQNLSGQQRYDVPLARMLESAVSADTDVLSGLMMAGGQPLVVKGFNVVNSGLSTLTGKNVQLLQLVVAGSLLQHYYASQAGSLFNVPLDRPIETLNSTNVRIRGSFTPSTTNYVGIDLIRTTDPNLVGQTADTQKFLDITTKEEITRRVPLGRILDYQIVISTQDFDSTPSVAPVFKVTTDSSNNITNLVDCRFTPFRLANGGSFPNTRSSYSWPQGRDEANYPDVFGGGDKVIQSHKDWSNAIMSRVWELGGGKYWYSPTADRNVRMIRGGTPFSNGEFFEWTGSNLHWKGLSFAFDNSGGGIYYNTLANQLTDVPGPYGTTATDLLDGDCIYIDIDRTSNSTSLSVIKGQLSNLGAPTIPGTRYVIAWKVSGTVYSRDSAFPVGTTFTVATTTVLGLVKLHQASLTPLAPVVFSDGDKDTATGVVGLNSNKQATVSSTTGTAITATSGGGGGNGITATANGTGAGVSATGGSTNGFGVLGTGGGAGGFGVKGISGSGVGVSGQSTTGPGGDFNGGGSANGANGSTSGSGNGLGGFSFGSGAGVLGSAVSGPGGTFAGGTGVEATNLSGGTGPVISTTPQSSNVAPQLVTHDVGGNPRFIIDHNGYRMGQTTDIIEDWTDDFGTMTTSASLTACPRSNKWSYWLFGSGSPSISMTNESDNNTMYCAAGLNSGTTSSGTAALIFSKKCVDLFSYSANISLVAEFLVTQANGTSTGQIMCGLTDNSGGQGNINVDTNVIGFVKRSGVIDYELVISKGGVGAYHDTGIAPSSSLPGDVLRFEVSGANVNAYINGVACSFNPIASAHPIATLLAPVVSVQNVGGVAAIGVFGPLRISWNNMVSPPSM